MRDCREEWFDAERKVAVTIVDVTSAAEALVRGHLSGPTAANYLVKGLAAAALLGAETSEPDETLVLQLKCSGPLGGLNVECTSAGTLRGYTERKILDDFDGLGHPDDRQVLGDVRLQVTRSVPGHILSQGISSSLDRYLADSLQRRATIRLAAAVTDASEVRVARGVMIEALPDAPSAEVVGTKLGDLAVASRNILRTLDLRQAELKRTTPLSFACRCSAVRAEAMLAALSPEERATLPPSVDVTCHMCGKIWTVKIREN